MAFQCQSTSLSIRPSYSNGRFPLLYPLSHSRLSWHSSTMHPAQFMAPAVTWETGVWTLTSPDLHPVLCPATCVTLGQSWPGWASKWGLRPSELKRSSKPSNCVGLFVCMCSTCVSKAYRACRREREGKTHGCHWLQPPSALTFHESAERGTVTQHLPLCARWHLSSPLWPLPCSCFEMASIMLNSTKQGHHLSCSSVPTD